MSARHRLPLRGGVHRAPLGGRDPEGRPLLGVACNFGATIGVRRGMDKRRVATAIVIVTSVWTLLHVYVAQRLLNQSPWPLGWRVIGWAGMDKRRVATAIVIVTSV